ncbi:UDP-2-acetamido-2,6-beta-L-arabino-hexul-4-ose reductase [Shewanella sp.]|uniref:UDP-2-acetamido-2,6-beta-L-arabino-hexul-4-ose reductase n=1 Tax=Shewanella sp. TaxID=50422 RepID=UPI0040476FF7
MSQSVTRVLITGANGFIGKNLLVRLSELPNMAVSTFVRGDDAAKLPELVAQADAVVHLAGENRPADEAAFAQVNAGLTQAMCDALRTEAALTGRKLPLVLASSTQAERDNPYGRSKLAAEEAVQALTQEVGNLVAVFRLPGVFGKWCKPNYNSVVATFCHNLARGLPIEINDPAANVQLVYVDDVVSAFVNALQTQQNGLRFAQVLPQYNITLGELAEQINAFGTCRGAELKIERVGSGLSRALYATYVSYLPNERFIYDVPQYSDARGVFVEMLKTQDSGQFSYFTARPGVMRGGHYHHTKTEKFLVIKGKALFRFRHLLTNELVEFCTSGVRPQVVDTIPGWTHDITNVGEDEMVVMLWANENFDRQKPDTVASKV